MGSCFDPGRLRDEVAWLGRALFPPACALCGAESEASFACEDHRWRRAGDRGRCDRCAALLPGKIPDGTRCSACRLDPPSWSSLIALSDYGADPAARAWLLALKHGGRRDLGRPLGVQLAERVRQSPVWAGLAAQPSAVVASVPLHPARRFVRGYDQAALVARALAMELGLAYVPGLVRTRATPPQGSAGSASRAANVREAFAVRRRARSRFAGRAVFLVDDVVTSGATANECVR